MSERRKFQRSRCLVGARVVFNNRSSTLSCTVRNRSEDGCLLAFGEQPYIPDQIEIVLDNRSTLMPAQVVWRGSMKVGIAFPRGRFMSELRADAEQSVALMAPSKPGAALH